MAANNLQQIIVILLILCIVCAVWGRAVNTKTSHMPILENQSKQLFLFGSGKETSTPDFVRLVVMRLIYGLASTMGMEERLEGLFNGAFVPPNADDGFFGFGGSDYGDGGLFGLFDDY